MTTGWIVICLLGAGAAWIVCALGYRAGRRGEAAGPRLCLEVHLLPGRRGRVCWQAYRGDGGGGYVAGGPPMGFASVSDARADVRALWPDAIIHWRDDL